ncbi:MAG: rhomboid family intramembrane serine protease [Fibrobacteres bacterium]|nr:rhomboid family intramembrane serine protease [Fibrobacterota bacterium]
MLVPIGSDTHDGSIGWFSLSVIIACVAVFVGTWPKQTDFEVGLQSDSLSVWTGTELRKMADSLYLLQYPGAKDLPRTHLTGFGASSYPAEFQEDEPSPGVSPLTEDGSLPSLDSLVESARAQGAGGVRYEDTANPMGRSDAEIALEMVTLNAKMHSDRALKNDLEARLKSKVGKIRGSSPLLDWGFIPAERWLPGILTSMFLHAGWGHLVGNMLFFFAFGITLERWFGMGKFIGFYLVGGIFASICWAVSGYLSQGHWSAIPAVGASGAIAATMGAYMRLMPKSKIKVAYWVMRAGTGHLPAWVFLGLWAIGQVVESHLMRHQEGGVAYSAHIGGFIFGIVAASILPRDPADTPMPELRPSVDREGIVEQVVPRTPIEEAWSHLQSGDEDLARTQFTRQFHEWIRQGEAGIDDISRNMHAILKKSPLFRFDPLPALEWGIAIAKTRHIEVALEFLHMASHPDHPLPAGLASRRDDLITDLESRQALASPPKAAPHIPPAPTANPHAPPQASRPAPDNRDWLIH